MIRNFFSTLIINIMVLIGLAFFLSCAATKESSNPSTSEKPAFESIAERQAKNRAAREQRIAASEEARLKRLEAYEERKASQLKAREEQLKAREEKIKKIREEVRKTIDPQKAAKAAEEAAERNRQDAIEYQKQAKLRTYGKLISTYTAPDYVSKTYYDSISKRYTTVTTFKGKTEISTSYHRKSK